MVHKYPNKSWQVSPFFIWPFVSIIQVTSKWWYNIESQWAKVNFSECCAVWKFLFKDHFETFRGSILTLGVLLWHWRKTCYKFIGISFEGRKNGKTKMVMCVCSSAASSRILRASLTSSAGLMLSSQTPLVSFDLLLTLLLGNTRLEEC